MCKEIISIYIIIYYLFENLGSTKIMNKPAGRSPLLVYGCVPARISVQSGRVEFFPPLSGQNSYI